jgi:putative Ca2+/H+ antiporter (TMEM165/GDT1 family)|tara:strand:- start:2802 stop:3386 length:585 start_codon:yes stop_codon:yes gene_type:complete
LEAFLVSLGAVAIAEIGDKTQLLALMLAMRFRAPLSVIAGIFAATVANHALAAFAGTLVAQWLTPQILSWILAVSFILMGLWALIPDEPPSEEETKPVSRFGPFAATTIAFFLVEMGDKTQLATVALGARYEALTIVALGTTLGMMAANVPVVLFGEAAAKRVPVAAMRMAAAALFIVLGLVALVSALGQGVSG